MTGLQPLHAAEALDRYFLEMRSKLLDVAAILDRLNRGGATPKDHRLDKVQKALAILQDAKPDRAERIQQVFSLTYDAEWERPNAGCDARGAP